MRDGQQDRQAPGSTDEVGESSQLESSSLPSMPTKTMTPSAVIAASMTRRIIGAPLLVKDAPLPTPAEFATGSYEEKMIHIEGLVEGLNTFIFGRNNLHKEVIKYSLSLEQAILALKKTKQKQVPPRPPSAEKAVCTSPIFSVNATDGNNNSWIFPRLATAEATVSAAYRVHHRPDAIVIKVKDASTYANILRTLKANPSLQQTVGSSVQNIRCSAAGALVLQLKKNVDNASTLGSKLDQVLGDAATATALQHTTVTSWPPTPSVRAPGKHDGRLDGRCSSPFSEQRGANPKNLALRRATNSSFKERKNHTSSDALLSENDEVERRTAPSRRRKALTSSDAQLLRKQQTNLCIGWYIRSSGRRKQAYSRKPTITTTQARPEHCRNLPPLPRNRPIHEPEIKAVEADNQIHGGTCRQDRLTGESKDQGSKSRQSGSRRSVPTRSADRQGSSLVQEHPARARPFFTWARISGIYFFSVYAPPRLADVEFSALLTNITEEARGKRPLIIAGDFNAWSTEWGCRATRQRATTLLDALGPLEAVLLNAGNTPTFTGALGYSVVDLMKTATSHLIQHYRNLK
ncbi:unnamed protein product [Trichogramma brassicae]|uniref:Endonuclease/exonuclease/phosphatase domain-containing protein n=1 Tax=Trichogramma brassicae TaxID=86971 RepID=A0A6H5HXS6_9HYME|nr:unnamed protein product [Trichogramma brassicae]